MRILNLYAGIGSNRRFWGDEHEVTAVELDKDIAGVYKRDFPGDKLVIGDAQGYLLEHYAAYDFVWASPPCPTHSQYRFNVGVRAKGYDPVMPDMTSLYGTIVFLQHHYAGLYVVENVKPYYTPLLEPKQVGRHYVWSNFSIPDLALKPTGIRDKNKIADLEEALDVSLEGFSIPNKRQVLRNCVEPEVGEHILAAAMRYEEVEQ